MPTVSVRYWAGAQRAAGVERETLHAGTLGELRVLLAARPELVRVAAVASFLVDGAQAGDDTVLHDGAEVDVLPPFAGGADERLTAVVSGRVQGVGFRYWVRRRAEPLRLTGTARNLANGDVEVIAEGNRFACEKLLAALRSDDPPGFVGHVDATWSPATGEYCGFRES